MNTQINHIKTNLPILFELLSVYITKKQIAKLKSNVKATWKVLNEILHRNNLASKIPASDKSHNSFLPINLVNSVLLDAAIEEEIIEIYVCGTCRPGTDVGNDNICMNLIKESIDTIINFSSYMHNHHHPSPQVLYQKN